MKKYFLTLITLIIATFIQTPTVFADGPLPLTAYPRPSGDNGMGIHWHTGVYAQDDEITDYFVAELKAMDIKWVKFLNDQTGGRHNDYLVQQLVANDIMPVMRIYTECNNPLNLGELGDLVDHYVPMGLVYFELYNEPDIPGHDGGWCDSKTPQPEYLASIWAPAAREIQAHGGYPSLPSIFPIGKNVAGWEDSFFQRFLRAIKAQGNTPVLYKSWGAVHNYFINHPPNYPQDDANLTGRPLSATEIAQYHLDEHQVFAINQARATQFDEGGFYVGDDPTLDVTNFQQFIAYHDQFTDIFGFEIPLISTEGGATVGSCEDPRYPCVDADMQKDWTLYTRKYMLDAAPDYYFATNTWLIAQKAMNYFGGTVWESNAWYHDLKGNHLPIVEALKNYPRKGEPRQNQKTANNWQATPTRTMPQISAVDSGGGGYVAPAPQPIAAPNAHSLLNYPHPPNDNGRGIHYVPTILGQAPDVADRFIAEMESMNIKWVKVMQGDIPKVEDQYLVEQLVAHGMEPVLRVYKPYNDPYENLPELVSQATKLGVHYFELYNEPNIAGFPGGWRDGESISVNRMLDLWIPAAQAVTNAGGYPGLPTLAPGGDFEDMQFLKDFLDGLQARNQTELLDKAWLPLHNYFLNHPLDYPQDDVNLYANPLAAAEIKARGLPDNLVAAINAARLKERVKNTFHIGATILDDSNGFRKFEAYGQIFFSKTGFYIPIISTEGGAIAGQFQDPRYPPVSNDDVTQTTVQAYQAMLNDVPAYYFAFTPWLLANADGGHWDAAWEGAAWYKLGGKTLPVVNAVKNDASRNQIRDWKTQIQTLESSIQHQTAAQPAVIVPPSDTPAAPQPAMAAASAKVVSASGGGDGWSVVLAAWETASTPYPRLYIDLIDANGNLLKNKQISVRWHDGFTILMPGGTRNHSASMHISSFDDVYTIGVAGGSGQAVQARGAEGQSLYVVLQKTE